MKDDFLNNDSLPNDSLKMKHSQMTFDGRHPDWKRHLMETTFDRTQLFMENNLQWMMTIDGRQVLMEENL